MAWLDGVIFGNSLSAWLLAIGAAAGAWMALLAARAVIKRRLTPLHDLLAALVAGTSGWTILVVAVSLGALLLELPAAAERGWRIVLAATVLLQLGLWGNAVLAAGVTLYVRRRMERDPAAVTTITVLGFMGRLLLWSLVLLVGLDNLGVDITALVAGLGIGGIAVALALQNVLGDLFAAFAIALDKPFSIGDFIIVDDMMGTVEHIGLKTTRIRSLFGEQVAVGNASLLDSRIRNYKRMAERRVVFSIGVGYETGADTLSAIPGMLREIVERQEGVRFDRAHFKAYGDFALLFEVVYHVLSPDYSLYMDIQQAINLAIFRRFAEAGIGFAYPTQTVHVRWAADGAGMLPAGTVR